MPTEDGLDLYDLLEEAVIPTTMTAIFPVPERWIAAVKRSMQTLVPKFNTERMLAQYYHEMYLPAARRDQELTADQYALARTLVDWKRRIPMRFSSLKLQEATIEGIHGDTIVVDQPLSVQVRIDPGKVRRRRSSWSWLSASGTATAHRHSAAGPTRKSWTWRKSGVLVFFRRLHGFGKRYVLLRIRVMPFHPQLATLRRWGLILWG
jgi:hypothetical protein